MKPESKIGQSVTDVTEVCSLDILGYEYRVCMRRAATCTAPGQCYSLDQTIFVRADLGEQAATSTLLHEIIEAVVYHLSMDLDNSKIMPLEAGLYQALTRNGVDLSPLWQRGDQE
jgi:hypothetical protein